MASFANISELQKLFLNSIPKRPSKWPRMPKISKVLLENDNVRKTYYIKSPQPEKLQKTTTSMTYLRFLILGLKIIIFTKNLTPSSN